MSFTELVSDDQVDRRDARAVRRAVDWLLEVSLIGKDDADRLRAAHPDPPEP